MPDLTEAEIRIALRAWCKAPDTLLVEELGILQGRVFIDLATVGEDFHGYEIKSAADTIKRLPRQIEAYSAVLDFATVVLAERHLDKALRLLPPWWGVLLVEGALLAEHRPALRNPEIQTRALVEILWSGEALDLLDARGQGAGMKKKARRYRWDALCEVYAQDELRLIVREILTMRHRG